MTGFCARPAPAGVRGRLRVPGDKSISHRALLLAARADGLSRVRGLADGSDVAHTLSAVASFGAGVEVLGRGEVVVAGGPDRLREPEAPVDVGNSGTGMRLMAGWAAALDGVCVLTGDASVSRRPMGRVTEPLRLMGASVDGRDHGRLPPLVVRGGHLHGIDYTMPVASAQVKGAILLAGLGADGVTTVREEVETRAHSEELLARFGAAVLSEGGGGAGPATVTLRPGPLRPTDLDVPGDPSQAAFWVVAACVTPGSDLAVENVYVGPARVGFLAVLERMGAEVEVVDHDPAASTATLRARHGPLEATEVGGPEVPGLIDEIPVLAVAAAYASGTTTFSGAGELRFKETDRIASMVAALASVGAEAEAREDGLVVRGGAGRRLTGGKVDSGGDHRVAMAMAVAALGASGPVSVSGWEAVGTSYPGFAEDYARCAS